MMGVCFSMGFAVADPLFRCFLLIVVLIWSILGPFALSFFLVETSTFLTQKGFHRPALSVAKLGVSVDHAIMPMVNLFGMVDSPIAVLNLMNQAGAMMCLCRFKDAVPVLESAVDKSQGALGWDHNLTQIAVGQLSSCLLYLGRFNEAEQYFRRGIAAKSNNLQPDETENAESQIPVVAALAMDRYGLGSLMEKQLKFDLAESQYKQAIETIDRFVFEDTDFLANHLNALGDLYIKTNRLEDAESCINRAFRIRKEIFPANHVVIASSYHSLGCLRLRQGNLYEAKKYLSDALRIKERYLGKSHPDVADTYRANGELETALNNFDKAEEHLLLSFKILDDTFGTHPDVARVMESLSVLYEKTGNDAKRQEFTHRAAEIRQSVEY